MKVLYLILNYKTYSDTTNLVFELLKQDNNSEDSILIVDNNSPNESFQQLFNSFKNEKRVEVIATKENGGYAKGNNFGLKYAKKYNPEFVCLINNDVHFSNKTIEKLTVLYNELPNPAIISPIQLLPDNKSPHFGVTQVLRMPTMLDDIKSCFFFYRKNNHEYLENVEIKNIQKVDMIPGAFLFIRYNVFEEIGFFDESTFLFGEERLLAQKIKDRGLSNYIVLDENYIHAHSTTINQESTRKQRAKYLYEGKMIYTKTYRRYPLLKCIIISFAYYLNRFLFNCYTLSGFKK